MALFTPTNQKRLTNVSIVRYIVKAERKRYRFEIACYPNKVVAWRQKLESNLNEVLQSDLIYFNVSKAEIASKESLLDAFKTSDKEAVFKIILDKGELQLTEKERQLQSENLIKDVSKIVASKTLNPTTKTCFTSGVIEKMLKDCHINLKPNKSAKQQSLDVIRLLKKTPDVQIELALFSVTVSITQKNIKAVKKELLNYVESVTSETMKDNELIIEAVFEPGNYDQFKTNCDTKCAIELTKIIDVVDEPHHNHSKVEHEAEGGADDGRNESDNESKDSEPIAAPKKHRRRAKNRSGGGDEVATPVPVEATKAGDESSGDDDNGKGRRRGKKKGNRK